MSYFLKTSRKKKGLYYQVYEGTHNSEKGYTTQKSLMVIGYHEELLKQGIDDPKAYAKSIVDKLEKERKMRLAEIKLEKISEETISKNLGVFLINSFLKKLDISLPIKYFNFNKKSKFDIYEVLKFLIFSQIYSPGSKKEEFSSLKNKFFINDKITYDQILETVETLGTDYKSVINITNDYMAKFYKRDTSKVYFDCTNYYFEIDKPYDDKQKGPSKENRKDPIIGMALLLDKNQLPLSMTIYPGNESEKPKIRAIIDEMKNTGSITGKTIQVADKGLNCGQNIFEAIKDKDGYIFSQSIKKLSGKEKKWVDNNKDFIEITNGEEVILKYKECVDDFEYQFEYNGKKMKHNFKQKRVLYWSKSLEEKHLMEINSMIEKASNLVLSKAKKNEFGEIGKYINFGSIDENGVIDLSNIKTILNNSKIEEDKKYCGYNMLVTSEVEMNAQEIMNVYKSLWRIEESFRILKTSLNARPVYLQKKHSIYGHFLVCYLSLLILRYIELVYFKDMIPMNKIVEFIRNFEVIGIDTGYLNLSNPKKLDKNIINALNLPIKSKYLKANDIEKFLNFKI